MSAYTRQSVKSPAPAQTPAPAANNAPVEGSVQVDGFAQVLAMLRAADPEFRESLLRRLGQRDPQLVRALRADLAKYL